VFEARIAQSASSAVAVLVFFAAARFLCAIPQKCDVPFERLEADGVPMRAGTTNRAYAGSLMRELFVPLPVTEKVTKSVDSEGYLTVNLQDDFPPLSEKALGLRIEVHYAPATLSEIGKKHKRYLFVPRGQIAAGARRIRPPGEPSDTALVHAREVLPANASYRTLPVTIPKDARLDLAVALRQDWPVDDAPPVRFRVSLDCGTTRVPLCDELVAPGSTNREWKTLNVDMSPYAGRQGRFVFETDDAGKGTPARTLSPLWGRPVLYVAAPYTHPSPTPNILLISLDTLRADHVGCYGYQRDTTPYLDAFAKEATLFETVVAPAPWTPPSHASVFTGLHPAVHEAGIFSKGYRLDECWTTLAEIAQRRQYLTAAFTEGVAIRGRMGLAQGFDLYSDGPSPNRHVAGRIERTFGDATAWLERYGHLPFFLFVHTYKIHAPYGAPEPWLSRFVEPDYTGPSGAHPNKADTPAARADAVNRYDAGIACADHHVHAFLERVRAMHLFDNTAVIVFSDHGEEFWEHGGYGHLFHIYVETLRVPLIIRMPGPDPPAGRVTRQVALSDVFATVLALMDEVPPDRVDAQSLIPLICDPDSTEYNREHVISQMVHYDKKCAWAGGLCGEWTSRSVRTETEHYIRSNRDSIIEAVRAGSASSEAAANEWKEELYDLHADPGEKSNVLVERPKRTAQYRQVLHRFLNEAETIRTAIRSAPSPDSALKKGDIEALRAGGYL